MLLEKCNYACYPIGSQRWHAEIARTTTFRNTADTESDLFDGSGETTVAPLDSELYAQVKAAVTADVQQLDLTNYILKDKCKLK